MKLKELLAVVHCPFSVEDLTKETEFAKQGKFVKCQVADKDSVSITPLLDYIVVDVSIDDEDEDREMWQLEIAVEKE